MRNHSNSKAMLAVLVGVGLIGVAQTGLAFDMGNMMNPSKWMGGDRHSDRDRGWDGPGRGYGYGAPGWAGMPYGQGWPGGYSMPGAYHGPAGYAAPMGPPGSGGYGPQGVNGGYAGPTGSGIPGYGGTPASGMAPPIAAPVAPGTGYAASVPAGSPDRSEIDALRARVRVLEERVGR